MYLFLGGVFVVLLLLLLPSPVVSSHRLLISLGFATYFVLVFAPGFCNSFFWGGGGVVVLLVLLLLPPGLLLPVLYRTALLIVVFLLLIPSEIRMFLLLSGRVRC